MEEVENLRERVTRAESRIERHREAIDKLEQVMDRTDMVVRKLAEQQAKQGWVMMTAAVLLVASQTGLLSAIGKLVALL